MSSNHPATRGWGDPSDDGYRKNITQIEVDGAKFNVHKKVATIFDVFLTRMCLENDYDIGGSKDDWSYIFRPIRGYEDEWRNTHNFKYLSNHSWGLAVDVNALKNPMNDRLITNMPVAWIREVAPKYRLDWGGDYYGRKDAMHFEFMGTPKDAGAIVDRINTRRIRTMATLDPEDLAAIDKIVSKHVRTLIGSGDAEKDSPTHTSLNDILREVRNKA